MKKNKVLSTCKEQVLSKPNTAYLNKKESFAPKSSVDLSNCEVVTNLILRRPNSA